MKRMSAVVGALALTATVGASGVVPAHAQQTQQQAQQQAHKQWSGITMVSANLHMRPAAKRKRGENFANDLRAVASSNPDFMSLNEMKTRTPKTVRTILGKKKWKAIQPVGVPGNAQAKQNMLAYRSDRWTLESQRTFVIVKKDPMTFRFANGREGRVDWARYAVVGTFVHVGDGYRVNVVVTHHMTNPGKDKARKKKYKQGMRTLVAEVKKLDAVAPTLIGGDMNSPDPTQKWSAGRFMRDAGYAWKQAGVDKVKTKRAKVDYVFYSAGARVATPKAGRLRGSDHSAWIGVRVEY